MTAVPPTRQQDRWRLTFLAFVAFALRLLPWRKVFRPEGLFFYDPDSYYHMRRVFLLVAHFPKLPLVDPWQNYPFGGSTIWPPLFDLPMAAIAWAIGLGHPSERLVEFIGAFYPAVVGALGIVAAASLGRALGGRRLGLLSALFLAVMPAHVLYSALGHPDQHVAEVLCSVAFFASLLRAIRPPAGPSRRARAARLGSALCAGVSLAASLLLWMGSVLFPAVGAAFVSARLLAALARREDARPIFAGSSLAFVSGAVFTALGTWLCLGRAETEITYVYFTWFLPAVALACAAAVFAFGLAVVWISERRPVVSRFAAACIAALALVGFLHPPGALTGTARYVILGFRHIMKQSEETSTAQGGEILTYNKTYLRTTQEYQPLLRRHGEWSTSNADRYLTRAWWLIAPVALWLFVRSLARRMQKGPGPGPGSGAEAEVLSPEAGFFFLPWAVVMGWMAANQVKYVYLASPVAAVSLGIVAETAYRALGRARGWRRGGGILFAAAALAWGFSPAVHYLSRFAELYEDVDPELYRALADMRRFTPEPGDWTDTTRIPAYGVLSFWDVGNYVEYIARRPVVANNNGYAYQVSFDFLMSEDEEEAAVVLEDRKCRYLVLTSDLAHGLASYLKEGRGDTLPYFETRDGALRPLPGFLGLVSARLFVQDGVGPKPLGRFRLVYESDPGSGAPSAVKIFELVTGTTIGGFAEPGSEVEIEIPIRTNRGRALVWRETARAGEDRYFQVTVPYSTEGGHTPTTAAGPLTIRWADGRTRAVTIREEEVQSGGLLAFWPPADSTPP